MTAPALLLAVAAGASVVAAAWRRRPLGDTRLLAFAAATAADRRRPSRYPGARFEPAVDRVATEVGSVAYRLVRRPDLAASAVESRRLGLAALTTAAVLPISPVAALLVGAALWTAPAAMAKRRDRRRRDRLLAGLPEIVDLLAVAVAAGLSLAEAIATVARQGAGVIAAEFHIAASQLALGGEMLVVLRQVGERVGDPAGPLVALLSASHSSGAPAGPPLQRLAAELRTARRQRAEAAARRVPVKLLFPLVGCVLPAFALLTVAPLLAGAARSLGLSR